MELVLKGLPVWDVASWNALLQDIIYFIWYVCKKRHSNTSTRTVWQAFNPKCTFLDCIYLDMLNMNMMRKIDFFWDYANSLYVSAIVEVLNQVYQTKDSWLAIVLHKTSWGRIVTSFPSILYFLPDMLFKTNGRICFLEKIEKYIIILEAMPSLSMKMMIVVLCITANAMASSQ